MRFIVGYLILIIIIPWQHNKKKARRIICSWVIVNNQASNFHQQVNNLQELNKLIVEKCYFCYYSPLNIK